MSSIIHLDTNFLIYYVGGGKDAVIQKVEKWQLAGHVLHVSAMAWAEFQCGPLLSEDNASAQMLLRSIVPITGEIADEAARLFQATGRRSRSLPDCIIAAAAIFEQAPLATVNRSDFDPFVSHGLQIL